MPKKRKAADMGSSTRLANKQQLSNQSTNKNLFELVWTQNKFSVLGRKQKGQSRRLGLSRSLAIEKRKKTLLQEFKERGKSNAFLDRRFGEYDKDLGDGDKSILRFQRERQLQFQRKSRFTLPEEEDEEVLTHKGAALTEIDDYNDDITVDNDEEQENCDMDDELKFGGFEKDYKGKPHLIEDEKKHRSKKEIMEEVVAKSKFYKALKAKDRDEDAKLKDKLDSEFATLLQSNSLLSHIRPKKPSASKSPFDGNSFENSVTNTYGNGVPGNTVKEKPDEFDKLIKEMGFEMRAHAGDRLKTSEELAIEERNRLEELENERTERMCDNLDYELDDPEISGKTEGRQIGRLEGLGFSGDDLGENFVLDGKPKRGWVDELFLRTTEGMETESDQETDVDEMEETLSDNGGMVAEEKREDEHDAEGLDPRDEPKCNLNKMKDKHGLFSPRTDKLKPDQRGPEELPYIIEAPQNLEAFKDLVANRSSEELVIVIQRIRVSNAVSLAAENRKKMQIFYNVLLSYFATLSAQKPVPLQQINALVRPLIEMSSETPYFAASCARQRLMQMHKQLSEKLRVKDGSSCWPSVKTIFLLRLWCMIFPSSDFRHTVMTPSMLLMAEYVLRCPVISGHDILIGSLICSLLLSVMKPAKRYCPEALMFLLALFSSALCNKRTVENYCPEFMLKLVASKPWLLLENDVSSQRVIDDLHFNTYIVADDVASILYSDNFRVKVLKIAVETLQGFMDIYVDLVSFPEIFAPFPLVLLEVISANKLPDELRASVMQVLELYHGKAEEHERMRQPLRFRAKQPVPIKQFNPKFEENFAQGRNYDPDRERAQKKKLVRQLKQEAKGAARELRKDNFFLMEEKGKEKMASEEIRNEKYRKAMSFLEEQEAAFKSGQLGKRRKRR